jgi:hypothetical protein
MSHSLQHDCLKFGHGPLEVDADTDTNLLSVHDNQGSMNPYNKPSGKMHPTKMC